MKKELRELYDILKDKDEEYRDYLSSEAYRKLNKCEKERGRNLSSLERDIWVTAANLFVAGQRFESKAKIE